MDSSEIGRLVAEVMARLESPEAPPAAAPQAEVRLTGRAAFADLDAAVEASRAAGLALGAAGLAARQRFVAAMRRAARENWRLLSEMAVEETGLGRVSDKITKNSIVTELTPGPEDLDPAVFTGDHGLTLIERAPFGV